MKRGTKPLGRVNIKWGYKFAYAIGLLVADGCLSKDRRHIIMTSIDKEQLRNFNACLNVDVKIGKKYSGSGNVSYYVQFSDVLFYDFLLKIGLSAAKSKKISEVSIPKKYFFDYLRGYFDGDGCSYSYFDSIYKNSFRLYISFASGSENHIIWLREILFRYLKITGSVSCKKNSTNFQLKYSKNESLILIDKMYYDKSVTCLTRKRLKICKSLYKLKNVGVVKLVNTRCSERREL